MKKILTVLTIIAGVFAFTACEERDEVTLASKPMPEQYVLAQIMIELIESETDISVDYRSGIGGGTNNIHPGMVEGQFDIYPEYTGTGWMEVLREDLIRDPDALTEAVREAYREEFDIEWLELYGFNNTYGLAMKEDKADEMGIETYSDLAEKADDLHFAAEYDFFEREDGMIGLEAAYGLEFGENSELETGLKYTAIGDDEVDVINVWSTDGRLKEYDLRLLEDDEDFFPSYYAATLIRQETLEEYPELEDVLNILGGRIDNETITAINYRVEVDNDDPYQVAMDFIESEGLLD